eukprot:Protomagalhaensia_wolfi_Nauph_80__4393@NODE_449_length_2512_cov_94_345734_g44_i2_p2_GENE_NODE_449_length_2512_cov_94_345734_g44_i2NODE_449_length_2512_cov_94_345734_g44_i2_p2_ORF_typecomplete_len364_score50_51Med10/PF09748_9/1_2e04Med10/PF09748_9/5_8e06_NODE_449_length_2512_cov_94_345734_g44_i2941185
MHKRPLDPNASYEENPQKKPKVPYGLAALLPPEVPIAFAPLQMIAGTQQTDISSEVNQINTSTEELGTSVPPIIDCGTNASNQTDVSPSENREDSKLTDPAGTSPATGQPDDVSGRNSQIDQVTAPGPLTAPQRNFDDPTSPANDDDAEDVDNSEEAVVERVQLLLMDAVEELSIVSRTLERWTVFAPSVGTSEEQRQAEAARYEEAVKKGKQRIIEHLRKALRKFRRLGDCTKNSGVFDSADLPVDLIAHVDSFLSPNTWLRALYDEIDYQNCVARGELAALASFHGTLKFYVNVLDNLSRGQQIQVPDFIPLPPTVLRPPVRRSDKSVDLVHVLTLLKGPVAPAPVSSPLQIRPPRQKDST